MSGPGLEVADGRTFCCQHGWRQEISLTAKRFNVGCQRQMEEALARASGTAPRLGTHRPGPPKCFPPCVLPFPGSVGCPHRWSPVCNATLNRSEGRSCGFGDGWQRAAGRTLLPPCPPAGGGTGGFRAQPCCARAGKRPRWGVFPTPTGSQGAAEGWNSAPQSRDAAGWGGRWPGRLTGLPGRRAGRSVNRERERRFTSCPAAPGWPYSPLKSSASPAPPQGTVRVAEKWHVSKGLQELGRLRLAAAEGRDCWL